MSIPINIVVQVAHLPLKFDAESIDEDNMAWGRPSSKPKRENRKRRKESGSSGRHQHRHYSMTSTPESPVATCRLWR